MAITFVGAHAALSNADTVPTHQAEDTIFQCGFRSSAATIPTDPGLPFFTYDTEAANTCAQRAVYRQAVTTTGEGATLTGATSVCTIVVRGVWGTGGGNAGTGSSATLNWPAFTLNDTSGNNFLVGFAASRSATNVQTTAPTGLTVVTTTVTSSAGYTGSRSTNWASQNQTVNTNTGWITVLSELSSFSTFNTIRPASNVTISGSNLASQSTSATGDRTVVTTYARQSGKYVFKLTFGVGSQAAAGNGVGLCNPSQVIASAVGGSVNSLGYFFDGSVFVNNVQLTGTTQAVYADGASVYVAVDITNKLMWSKNGILGTWTGSPDAGTGGLSISALTFTGGIMPCRAAGSVETATTVYDGSASGHGLTTFTPWDNAANVTHTSTGVLVGPGSIVAGTARHIAKHATSGTLVGQGSAVAGTARHLAKHTTSGVLIGPGSTVTGTAKRFRAHPASGALTGPGATVLGTAARSHLHSSTGVLVGQGSLVAGIAARTHAHSSSGTLIGPGAVITGAADHEAHTGVHNTTGALVGQGSIVSGLADHIPAVIVSRGGHFIPLTRKQQQALQKRLREDRKRKEEEIIERRLSDEMITQDIRDAISGPRTELVSAPTINDMDVGVEDDDSDEDLELLLLYG